MKKIIPWNAGLESEPKAVERRLNRLLESLSKEINVYTIKRGEVTDKIWEFSYYLRQAAIEDGWRVSKKTGKLLIPKDCERG